MSRARAASKEPKPNPDGTKRRVPAGPSSSSGGVSDATRFGLAAKLFAHTASYDGAIANYLYSLDAQRQRLEYPEVLSLPRSPRLGFEEACKVV